MKLLLMQQLHVQITAYRLNPSANGLQFVNESQTYNDSLHLSVIPVKLVNSNSSNAVSALSVMLIFFVSIFKQTKLINF